MNYNIPTTYWGKQFRAFPRRMMNTACFCVTAMGGLLCN